MGGRLSKHIKSYKNGKIAKDTRGNRVADDTSNHSHSNGSGNGNIVSRRSPGSRGYEIINDDVLNLYRASIINSTSSKETYMYRNNKAHSTRNTSGMTVGSPLTINRCSNSFPSYNHNK